MLILNYYTAPWCGPCRTFKPIVEDIVFDNAWGLRYIDIDNDPQAAEDDGIMSVPTVRVGYLEGDYIEDYDETQIQWLGNIVGSHPPMVFLDKVLRLEEKVG